MRSRRNLRQAQRLFDELRQAILHTDARAQLVSQGWTLFRYVFDGAADFAESAILLAVSGLRTQPHKGRA